jgi:hypothetical protein
MIYLCADTQRLLAMMSLQAKCTAELAATDALAISTGRDYTAAAAACEASYDAQIAAINARVGSAPTEDGL